MASPRSSAHPQPSRRFALGLLGAASLAAGGALTVPGAAQAAAGAAGQGAYPQVCAPAGPTTSTSSSSPGKASSPARC
ncbi:hypothetical protein ACFQ0B_49840 [Nonomuraea thailandensis]